VTKAEFVQLKRDARSLSMDIGVRPAARALGLSESRVQKWSHREKWNIQAIRPRTLAQVATEPAGTIDACDVKQAILAKYSDRTRIGLARTACTASETLAEYQGSALLQPKNAISAEQYSKVADRVHGWSAERAQAPTVNIANVVLPTPAEREAMSELDSKLDAFTRRLMEHHRQEKPPSE
jgi:hypothetical protein